MGFASQFQRESEDREDRQEWLESLPDEIADLRAKLATETKRAQAAEAQRDKFAELLRECFHDGLESYWLRDRVEDALAEVEKHDAK